MTEKIKRHKLDPKGTERAARASLADRRWQRPAADRPTESDRTERANRDETEGQEGRTS